MGKKMKNAPVYHAWRKFASTPLAALETYIPAVQERFRKAGYPDFKQLQTVQLVLGGSMPKTGIHPSIPISGCPRNYTVLSWISRG